MGDLSSRFLEIMLMSNGKFQCLMYRLIEPLAFTTTFSVSHFLYFVLHPFFFLHMYFCEETIKVNFTSKSFRLSLTYYYDIFFRPSWDYAFERNIVYNHSYNLFIFSLDDIPRDLKEVNRTHYYKTMIVANDPADFGRNSYGTNTLNSVMEAFHHHHLDLLKIDRLADRSHAYELLYYMAEDHILQNVQQLHITVHIGEWHNGVQMHRLIRAIIRYDCTCCRVP